MKKDYFGKTWSLLLFFSVLHLSSFNNSVYGQCNNTIPWSSATVGPAQGNSATISCQYPEEYGPWSGIQAAYSYTTTSTVATDYITVRSGSAGGPVVAHGQQPLTWVASAAVTYYIHVNLNAACATGTGCRNIVTTNNGPSSACTNPTAAGSATSSVANACTSQPFSLGLSGNSTGTGISYQWESSSDNVTYAPISGANTATYSAMQNVPTYYRCVAICSGGAASTSTEIYVGQNTFANCYCSSNATSIADEDILGVHVSTLSNVSTCTTTGGPGSITQQYSNYTATVAAPDLARTVDYPMTIDIGTCGTGSYNNMSKVYIDFNQNGLFTDAGENVYATPAAILGAHSESFTFNVPVGAALGITRMRIVNVETTVGANINPCGTYTWGETEDYFVNIAPVPTCPQPTAFTTINTTTSTATLDWTAGGAETVWQIQYGPAGFALGTGTIVTVSSSSDTILAGLTPYSFFHGYVRGICGPGDTSFWTPKISFNTYGLGQYMEMDMNCAPGGFVDVSTLFAPNPLITDGEAGFTLPWPFYFQGAEVNQITVGNNGAVVFHTISAQISPTNANTMATTAATGLYPFWDDMDDNTGNVYYGSMGTAPNRKFVVQWNMKHDLFLSGTPFVYQLIMEEGTGKVYYQYQNTVTGSVTYNNGASATVGISGPNQDFALSFNNAAFLSANNCLEFYYTDCPKPTNLIFNYVFSDEAGIDWTAGLSNETSWTVIYGPAGFDPTQGGVSQIVTSSDAVLAGLTQLTSYDLYIYANCAVGDSSFALIGSFTTLPLCANPTSFTGASAVDSIFGNWAWAASDPMYIADGFELNYAIPGFDPLTAGTTSSSDATPGDTIDDPALLAGGVYEVYLRAVCDTLVSGYVGPIVITMPLTNDNVCAVETLTLDGISHVFSNAGATAEVNESNIAPPVTGAQTTTGWLNNTLNFTTWFKFVAPSSGEMRINATGRPFNGQLAVYQVITCADFNSFTLIAANDDAIGGGSLAPNFTVCGLTPGAEYYLMHDSYSTTATGQYALNLSSIDLDAGNSGALVKICSRDTINLFTGITGYQAGGVWNDIDGTFHLVDDSLFNTAGLAVDTYNFEYRLTDGCATDAVQGAYQVFPASSAGTDGSLTICRNEPFSTISALGGTFQTNGTWYNASGTAISGPNVPTGTLSVPGTYNYTYIVGNQVCPDDSSIVSVNVLSSCNFLGVEELSNSTISFFPNPTKGNVTVTPSANLSNVTIVVTDVNGKILFSEATDLLSKEYVLDLGAFERGTYLVTIDAAEGKSVARIIKE